MLPIETLDINSYKVELYPVYAYDILTNLHLLNKVLRGEALKDDVDSYLRIVFSNCRAYSSDGKEVKMINPAVFKDIFGSCFQQMNEAINTIMINSAPSEISPGS